ILLRPMDEALLDALEKPGPRECRARADEVNTFRDRLPERREPSRLGRATAGKERLQALPDALDPMQCGRPRGAEDALGECAAHTLKAGPTGAPGGLEAPPDGLAGRAEPAANRTEEPVRPGEARPAPPMIPPAILRHRML